MIESPPAEMPARRKLTDEQRSVLNGALLYLAFYTGMVIFNTFPPPLPPVLWAILPPLTTIAYLLLLVNTMRLLCRLPLNAKQATMLMLVTLVLFLVANPVVGHIAWELLKGAPWKSVMVNLAADYSSNTPVGLMLSILVPFLLILTGTFFGQLVAQLIKEQAILVPVALISAMVDFYGVYWGPVSDMSAAAPAAVTGLATAATQVVSVPAQVVLPPALAMFGNIAPPDNIGIGDFVFLAFFLTCAYRLGFSAKRTMWGIFAGLLVTSILLAMEGQTFFGHTLTIEYLPGLVFISGGVLLANLRVWKLTRQEWAMTGLLVAIFAVFIGISIAKAEYTKYKIEQAKPKVENSSYAVMAGSGAQAFARALEKVDTRLTPVNAKTELLEAQFGYLRDRGNYRMVEWRFVVLQRPPQPKDMKQMTEVAAVGQAAAKNEQSWGVRQSAQCPPELAISLLLARGQSDKDKNPFKLLLHARIVPDSALALIEKAPRLLPRGSSPELVILQLQAGHAVLAMRTGKTVKTREIGY